MTENIAESIVEAINLTKTFHPKKMPIVTALDHIHLSVRAGELTALVGPDGAGKTTFLRLICGLMDADEGSLRVGGMDVTADEQAVQDILSYMPQKFGLACTLVRSPKLLILDEPTVGVDPLSRRELWEILQTLTKQEHLSVLVSTAYMDEAALCQTVHVLNHGRILASGTPEELRHIADGRCCDIAPTNTMPMRMLQSRLLDDPGITDAVPVCGKSTSSRGQRVETWRSLQSILNSPRRRHPKDGSKMHL